MRALQPPGWPRARGYAHGIEATGRLVFTAGQIGWGPDGGFPSSDLAGQVRQTLENVLAVLAEAGAGPEHVVRTRTYLTDAGDWEEVGRAHGQVFADIRPASTMIVVHGFLDPRWLVEMEADAILPT